MLLAMHRRTNTSVHKRANPAVPELDSNVVPSDTREVRVPLLQEAIRVRRRIKVDRADSGITLRRERATRLVRDYTLGLQDSELAWRATRGAAASKAARSARLADRLGHRPGGSNLGARRIGPPSCNRTTCTVRYDESIEGVRNIGADVG